MKRKDSSTGHTTRRQALTIITGSALTQLHFPVAAVAGPQAVSHGAHPPEPPSTPYALQYFSPQQARSVDALAEVIIPADDHSPGAKAARVSDYIDEILASSPREIQKLWADGIGAMEAAARAECGLEFAKCSPSQQLSMIGKISRNEDQPATLEEKFFVALKAATIDGYYTSKIGIHQEIEYQGNAVLADFPGCTHQEHKAGTGDGDHV